MKIYKHIPSLTEYEKSLLTGIQHSDYNGGFDPEDCRDVWSDYDLLPTLAYTKAQHSGVIASLVKKGLIVAVTDGKDSTIRFTDAGAEAYHAVSLETQDDFSLSAPLD